MARSTRVGAGLLTEQLTILSPDPQPIAVASITRTGSVATVTTSSPHGFETGDYVQHAGATQSDYNVEAAIVVTGATTYTFPVSGSPESASGPVTATFVQDAAGGQREGWFAVATVFGQVVSLNASEQLQARAIGAVQTYLARIYYRPDVTPAMRVAWRPYLRTVDTLLEIHGVQPDPDDPRMLLQLTLGEVA